MVRGALQVQELEELKLSIAGFQLLDGLNSGTLKPVRKVIPQPVLPELTVWSAGQRRSRVSRQSARGRRPA